MRTLESLLVLFPILLVAPATVIGGGELRNVAAHDGSVYAFVAKATDYASARTYCRGLEVAGQDASGKKVALSDFDLARIETKDERDWIHGRIYGKQRGLNQYTWAGEVRYRGAPEPPSGQQLIFGTWNSPEGLQSWPEDWNSAFVCEMVTALRPLPLPETVQPGPRGEIFEDDTLLYEGHLYIFAARGRTYEEAITFCNSLERRADGVSYPAFQLLQLDSADEQAKVHALIQKNGGAWTWAGQVKYPGAIVSTPGFEPVFTQWDRPDVLTLQPRLNKYALVCESVGRP